MIAEDNQENGKSDNAAFLQILISFYIQSEASVSSDPSSVLSRLLFESRIIRRHHKNVYILFSFLC